MWMVLLSGSSDIVKPEYRVIRFRLFNRLLTFRKAVQIV
jgi:hypothetical protein